MKDAFWSQLATLRPKTYCYFSDGNDENKKAKGTKKFVIKQKLKFGVYKHCLKVTQLKSKINQLENKPT